MPLETWLVKVKTKLAKSKKSGDVGFLSFEVAGMMTKLLHLWRSLSDNNLTRLHNDSIRLAGVHKIVLNDDVLLLGLACAELVESLRLVGNSVAGISRRCDDHVLRSFDRVFRDFADSGRDPNCWVLGFKEMEAVCKKMDRYSSATATLYKDMDEVFFMENRLRKAVLHGGADVAAVKEEKIVNLQQKIFWKKQEVKYLKDRSLWNRSFDAVTAMLARSVFTVLARIKLVFGVRIGMGHGGGASPASLHRSLSAAVYPSDPHRNFVSVSVSVSGPLTNFPTEPKSPENEILPDFFDSNSEVLRPPETTLGAAALPRSLSAAVYPSDQTADPHRNFISVSGPETNFPIEPKSPGNYISPDFFNSNSDLLIPPETTLGAAALGVHYANLIIVMEKMIQSPQLVGPDARDDLYAMLPASVRSALRRRLKGVGFRAADDALAGEWRDALGRILRWLTPMAHNTIKYESERSFEKAVPRSNVMLFQTLFFADTAKTEAAITELLVGLNYVWRFEREMTAMALFECSNSNNGSSSMVS